MDVVRLFKTVDSPISAETMRYATLWPNIRNTDELARRGLQLRSARETFADSIAWMVKVTAIERPFSSTGSATRLTGMSMVCSGAAAWDSATGRLPTAIPTAATKPRNSIRASSWA